VKYSLGPAMAGTGTSVGTVFIVGKALKDDPKRAAYVLVTATHVLTGIKGTSAILLLRKKNNNGTYMPIQFEIPIRDHSGTDLFLKHETADVSVMYVRLPKEVEVPLIGTNLIVDDKTIKDLEIHPGDELLCLGYPFGLTVNDWGFPILRSGIISSYPLTPASVVRFIGFDFRVYGGNSGGPVYFKYSSRTYSSGTHLGETVHGIIGLVTQQVEDPNTKTPISLAHIVPGQFIRDVVDKLPEPKP
jgi:S1-C subfamily serine protease